MSYQIIPLNNMISELEEGRVKEILSSFSCPMNGDIERFCRHTSIAMERQGVSRTYLVYTQYKGGNVLVGYFTLASKTMVIPANSKVLSNNMKRRINKFAVHSKEMNQYLISAPLIGQLSKNFSNDYNRLISGSELLSMACDKVREVHGLIGGKLVYLECENKPQLIEFYTKNGFVPFADRSLDRDEKEDYSGDRFIQMLRYL